MVRIERCRRGGGASKGAREADADARSKGEESEATVSVPSPSHAAGTGAGGGGRRLDVDSDEDDIFADAGEYTLPTAAVEATETGPKPTADHEKGDAAASSVDEGEVSTPADDGAAAGQKAKKGSSVFSGLLVPEPERVAPRPLATRGGAYRSGGGGKAMAGANGGAGGGEEGGGGKGSLLPRAARRRAARQARAVIDRDVLGAGGAPNPSVPALSG